VVLQTEKEFVYKKLNLIGTTSASWGVQKYLDYFCTPDDVLLVRNIFIYFFHTNSFSVCETT
jgi:hypothetical protein